VDTQIVESAKTGDAHALHQIGEVYYKIPNHAKAMTWYLVSAKKNNAAAQNGIGHLYHHGEGVEADFKVAMDWYIKSANQGYPEAMYNIGELHYNGQGVLVDKQQAITWYKKSEDAGLEKGKLAVVKLNEEGIHVDNTQQGKTKLLKVIPII
jgi:TPR repeat protein